MAPIETKNYQCKMRFQDQKFRECETGSATALARMTPLYKCYPKILMEMIE